jgi:hypothetical protein
MNLAERLKEITGTSEFDKKTVLKIKCTDGATIKGTYRGFTQALDNDPEIAQLDVFDIDKNWSVGILETEIESIEIVE